MLTSINRREFLRAAALTTGGLALAGLPARSASSNGVPASRLARLATGANVCLWFRFPRNGTAEHFQNYIPEAEALYMAQMGLKHIRLCVAPKVIMDASTGAILEERGQQLEAAIARFQKAGLLVMVDIHNEDRAAELNPAWQEAFVRFWGSLASRLSKYDPELTILEIINEPVFNKREEEWNTLNGRLAAAIRKNAPEHTIVTSGPNWGGIDGLKQLKLLPDTNVVYSFHCYDPFTFTHQGATWSSEAVKPLRHVPYPSSPEVVAPLLAGLEAHRPHRRWWNATETRVGARTSWRPGSARGLNGARAIRCRSIAGSSACFLPTANPSTARIGFAISARFWPPTALGGPSGAGTRVSVSTAGR